MSWTSPDSKALFDCTMTPAVSGGAIGIGHGIQSPDTMMTDIRGALPRASQVRHVAAAARPRFDSYAFGGSRNR